MEPLGSAAAVSLIALRNLWAVKLLYLLVYNGYSWQRSCYISNFTMEPPGSAVAVSLIVQVYYGTSWQCSCCISYSTTEPLGSVAAVSLTLLWNLLAV